MLELNLQRLRLLLSACNRCSLRARLFVYITFGCATVRGMDISQKVSIGSYHEMESARWKTSSEATVLNKVAGPL